MTIIIQYANISGRQPEPIVLERVKDWKISTNHLCVRWLAHENPASEGFPTVVSLFPPRYVFRHRFFNLDSIDWIEEAVFEAEITSRGWHP